MTAVRPQVWAPAVRHVAIDVAGDRWPMTPNGGGWWITDRDVTADYAFVLDDGPPRPDPRSRAQPNGVHGPSRWFDPGEHHWGDADFVPVPLRDAVIYELHIGTFSAAGTYAGAAEHLEHLVDLGITHVEVMPVNTFAGRHGWGYDGVALFAPHAPYGEPAELQRFVDACHARGLAVILDVVYNHLGPVGNHLRAFGPYFTDAYKTPWGEAVNFDGPGSDEVRQLFIDNACMWLRDFHFDGLRLDAMHAVIDTSATHWLVSLRRAVDEQAARIGRPAVLIAEHDGNDPAIVDPLDRGGRGMDAMWNDDLHHALHRALTGESSSYYGDFDGLDDVADALVHGYVFRGRHSAFRGRIHGRALEHRDADALVASLQNHDQVGNRARGDRIGQQSSAARQRVGAAILLTAPHVPLLFQGEEWAASSPFPYFADHDDPELAAAVREGRRREFAPFGWRPEDVLDPEDEATFVAARLPWDEVGDDEHATTLRWYRQLIRLRSTHPALRGHALGTVHARTENDGTTLVVRRGSLILVAHLGAAAARVTLEAGPPPRFDLLLACAPSGQEVRVAEDGLHMPVDSAAIVEAAPA